MIEFGFPFAEILSSLGIGRKLPPLEFTLPDPAGFESGRALVVQSIHRAIRLPLPTTGNMIVLEPGKTLVFVRHGAVRGGGVDPPRWVLMAPCVELNDRSQAAGGSP